MAGSDVSFLIVDDEALLALSLSRLFASHGRVNVVSSLAEARDALGAERYDALVVDVELPDGSGFDLLEDARRSSPHAAALVLSGRVDATRLALAYTFGAAFLLKPALPAQLGGFALRARSRRLTRVRWLRSLMEAWIQRYGLTTAEEKVLSLAIGGRPRCEIAASRGVTELTLKKQVQSVLRKTGDSSLECAANRALREALGMWG